ncbi:hypothetical protein B0T16DRAFT_174338 [Cercophora newfieldiana]|uniref:DUF7708 domain-containing protein n=1 Tax=Cercophora newfieldiana TaxID=92897 RepID=A0AA39Y0K5_9PEZI|nr:hypothetical protein B0T16DRAFT_174338 [Cercophora newfieldiana]
MEAKRGSRGRSLEVILNEGQLVKRAVSNTVERFSNGPNSPLDGSFHPALREGARRETQTTLEADAAEEQFKAAMREYEATSKPKYKTGVDPDSEHGVQDLWDAIDEATEKYQVSDTKGAWGKVRVAFRKLGDNKQAAEGWLGLLPHESHYLSVVCGGLKLVIHAAARMRKIADMILEKFSEIPILLSGTRRVLSIFKDSSDLHTHSKALYTSILSAIGHMLHYLKRKSGGKTLKAFFGQESFEFELTRKIEDVAKQRDVFNEHAELCHKEALRRLEETTKSSAEANDRNADGIKTEIRSLRLVVRAADEERERVQRAIANAMSFMAMEQAELRREVAALREANVMAVQYFKQLMRANPVAADIEWSFRTPLDPPDPPITRPPRRTSSLLNAISPPLKKHPPRLTKTLLSHLTYDPSAPLTDLRTNYALGPTLPIPAQDRAVSIINSPQLTQWIESAQSTALVINGNSPTVTPKSAPSFVAARLVYVLNEIRARADSDFGRGIVPLYFSCAQHVRRMEDWETPVGVVHSLIAQLVMRCEEMRVELDLSKGGKRMIKSLEADGGDIRAVFGVFKRLLGLLPTEVSVFCVVDGLSFYVDDRATSEDARYLAVEMMRLAGRRQKGGDEGPVVKVLLAAPKRLRVEDEVMKYSRVSVLNVPQGVPSLGGFTAAKWEVALGRQLAGLEIGG